MLKVKGFGSKTDLKTCTSLQNRFDLYGANANSKLNIIARNIFTAITWWRDVYCLKLRVPKILYDIAVFLIFVCRIHAEKRTDSVFMRIFRFPKTPTTVASRPARR